MLEIKELRYAHDKSITYHLHTIMISHDKKDTTIASRIYTMANQTLS